MRWVTVEQGGRRVRVAVARGPEGVWVSYPGGAALVKKSDHAAQRGKSDALVRAPMTARVVQVSVKPNDEVAQEQLLVVLEAMKMEYRLTAPRAATVAAVHCAVGELVDLGKVLVSFTEAAA
jgi:acetyl/propionyl-CoA carboxylase alpha subunit